MKYLGIVALAAFTLYTAELHAQDLTPEVVRYDLKIAYVPNGFDSNDKIQFVVEGSLPSTCYRTGPFSVKVNKLAKRIEVRQKVYKYNTLCLYMLVPFHKVVDLGILDVCSYKVVNENETEIGMLSVRPATTAAADDYLYAPVSDVRVKFNEQNEPHIVVEGKFTDSCMAMKELKAFPDGSRVITVLPIAERIENGHCTSGSFPFTHTVELPKLPVGRYVLNTRTLNGEGVFKFFEIFNWE